MKGTAWLGVACLLAACVNTQMTPLAGFSPQRVPTCWQAVNVFASMQGVDTPYVELAYLHAGASDPVGDDKIIKSLRKKAAQIGANGILFRGIQSHTGSVGFVTGVLESTPTGDATAIWMPKDSAATVKLCADSAKAR